MGLVLALTDKSAPRMSPDVRGSGNRASRQITDSLQSVNKGDSFVDGNDLWSLLLHLAEPTPRSGLLFLSP